MRVGISLNEVVRGFLKQFILTYSKYIDDLYDEYKETPIENLDLIEYLNILYEKKNEKIREKGGMLLTPKFKNVDDLNRFLYIQAPLEIFGYSDQIHDDIMVHINKFAMDLEDDELGEIKIVVNEHSKAISGSLFFLSKLGSTIRKYEFVKTIDEMWNSVDVLITANPNELEKKPKNKKSVKVLTSYNEKIDADITITKFNEINKKIKLIN